MGGLKALFKNLDTFKKVMAGFAGVGAIAVAVGVVGLLGLQTLREQLRVIYETSTVALADLGAASGNLGLYHNSVLAAGQVTRKLDFDEAIRPLNDLKAKTMESLKGYAAVQFPNVKSAEGYAGLNAALNAYFTAVDGALGTLQDSFSTKYSADEQLIMRTGGTAALSVEVSEKYKEAMSKLRDLLTVEQELARIQNETGQETARQRKNIVLYGAIGIFAVAVIIGYLLARSFARGVTHIAQVAKQAAAGHLQARARVESRDELGQMAAAFNTMLDRITKLVQTEEERDVMQKRLMEFLVLVSEVSKGDLTKRGTVTADMYGNLADAFNLMLDRFGKLMRQVKESAERVNEAAAALKQNAAQMAGTAQHQAHESTQALTAVDGLAISMRQVADTATESSDSAKQALTATERGRVAVQETVQDMQNIRAAVQRMSKQVKGLGDRSLEISQIVSTIREIANQTNLLALNAAIEAAGAGEAGARFAVVADQIRKLAESSTQATREIAELVKGIQTETQDAVIAMEHETQAVEAGSASAMRTGDVFKEISQIAQRSAEYAQLIAQSSVQQSGSTEEVANVIKGFAGGSVTTQKAAEETRHTVEEMGKLAEGLTTAVGQFKIA
jgi:twitching motility protein PilJ